MKRTTIISIGVLWVVLTAPAAQRESATTLLSPWTARLEQLDPDQPMAYFELAEEIADVAEAEELRAIARRLFALAGALDSQRLGRSAALALADMEQDSAAKQRLLALASLLNPHADGASSSVDEPLVSTETLEAVAEAFSNFRRGYGPQALSAMEQADSEALLRRYGRLLPGGYNRFVQDCRIYKAGLRPMISDWELAQMLHLEAALLAGEHRQWSSDLVINDAAPLIEVDPQRLAETFGVDAERCVYRNGAWGVP